MCSRATVAADDACVSLGATIRINPSDGLPLSVTRDPPHTSTDDVISAHAVTGR